MKKQNSGFSLIELLVVIVIMGILATISIGTFAGFFSQARDAKRKAFVDTASSIIKAENASNWTDASGNADNAITGCNVDSNTCKYLSSGSGLGILLKNNDVDRPKAEDLCTLYCFISGKQNDVGDNQFFVASFMEKDKTVFVNGTLDGMSASASLKNADEDVTRSHFTCTGRDTTGDPANYTCEIIEQ